MHTAAYTVSRKSRIGGVCSLAYWAFSILWWSYPGTHTHYTRLTAICPGLPGCASTRKVKPIWILLKQQTVSGSGISWPICKSAPRSRQITMPAPHHSVFLRARCPSCHPTSRVKALKASYQGNPCKLWINICASETAIYRVTSRENLEMSMNLCCCRVEFASRLHWQTERWTPVRVKTAMKFTISWTMCLSRWEHSTETLSVPTPSNW